MQIALTVAGSDPAGGAGIQADLRTFAAHGVHGLSAITAVIAQGTRGVRDVWPVDPAHVRRQIEVVLSDVTAHAMKTGALLGCTDAILDVLPDIPLVVDPVMASSSGATLLDDLTPLRDRLMPRATLITPNLRELAVLTDTAPANDVDELMLAAERLLAMGARAVLAKGGHLPGDPIDVLMLPGETHRFVGPRIATSCTRGTGCTLSAAITAELARGASVLDAVKNGRAFLRAAMERAEPIGDGDSPAFLR